MCILLKMEKKVFVGCSRVDQVIGECNMPYTPTRPRDQEGICDDPAMMWYSRIPAFPASSNCFFYIKTAVGL
jgi:hypothetical protein